MPDTTHIPTPRYGLQLFTVRDELERDFAGTVRQVARIGFSGVETAFVGDQDFRRHRAVFDENGLGVIAVHVPLPVGDAQESAFRQAQLLGTTRVVWHGYPRDPRYDSREGVYDLAHEIANAGKAAQDAGLQLSVHNHWWEIADLGGYVPFQIIAEEAPEVSFELDTYWSAFAGVDPVQTVRNTLGGRVPLAHLKDGPLGSTESPMVALGDGSLDLDRILEALSGAEWWIVELDYCASDVFAAIAKSLSYLQERSSGRIEADRIRKDIVAPTTRHHPS